MLPSASPHSPWQLFPSSFSLHPKNHLIPLAPGDRAKNGSLNILIDKNWQIFVGTKNVCSSQSGGKAWLRNARLIALATGMWLAFVHHRQGVMMAAWWVVSQSSQNKVCKTKALNLPSIALKIALIISPCVHSELRTYSQIYSRMFHKLCAKRPASLSILNPTCWLLVSPYSLQNIE